MIERSENGRVSGFWIVRNLIGERLIHATNKLIEETGCRIITDVTFSQEIRFDPVIREHLSELAEEFARLYYFVEADSALVAPAYLLSEEVFRAFDGQDLTGMAFLDLFFRGHAKMYRHGGRYSVAVEEAFLHGIPDGEKKMKRLGERVLEFSGEQAPVYTEKMLTEVGTETVNEGISVSFSVSRDSEELPVYLKEENELTDRERIVRKNYVDNMVRLAELIGVSPASDNVPQKAEEVESEVPEAEVAAEETETAAEEPENTLDESVLEDVILTFEKAHEIQGDGFSFRVPDGFMWRLDSDKKAFGIYGPLKSSCQTGCPVKLLGTEKEEEIPVNAGEKAVMTVRKGALNLAVIVRNGCIRPEGEWIEEILGCVNEP